MARTIICSLTILFIITIATVARGDESFISKICGNDVPDCICRWCCPDYCRKPLPCVCGPLPPHLTCGPSSFVPFWCRKKPTCTQKVCVPPLDNTVYTAPTPQPEQVK